MVHCYAGVSRSSTSIILYMMRKFMWSLDDILLYIKLKRNVVEPNQGFIE